jgi:hypothetical protein
VSHLFEPGVPKNATRDWYKVGGGVTIAGDTKVHGTITLFSRMIFCSSFARNRSRNATVGLKGVVGLTGGCLGMRSQTGIAKRGAGRVIDRMVSAIALYIIVLPYK